MGEMKSMGLDGLKEAHIRRTLAISEEKFKKIFTFIDFANLNHWYEDDPYDLEGKPLKEGQKVEVDIDKLKSFLNCFSQNTRFYYGHDPSNEGSMRFLSATRHVFGNHVFTKRIQKIRHTLTPDDSVTNTRLVHSDDQGSFVWIPKCNFDVEIAVDAMRLSEAYDTICLLSSDADFAALIQHLKSKKSKKVILIKGGRIDGSLGKLLDLKLNASDIKSHIAYIKQKPGTRPGSADSQPESTGREG